MSPYLAAATEPDRVDEAYFGRLNEIYFRFDGRSITSVADRARRTQPVEFVEQLLGHVPDAGGMSLASSSLVGLLDTADSNCKSVVRAGRSYEVQGEALEHIELGGRTLYYDTLECVPARTRVLLTISVPAGCMLKVDSPLFNAPSAHLSVKVHATGTCTVSGCELQYDCTGAAGEIAFLFESRGTPHPLARTAIICGPGRERDAVVARAAFGADFVPALVLPHPSLWTEVLRREAFDRVLILPSGRALYDASPDLVLGETIRNSALIREALGLSSRKRRVAVPEAEELLGPGLAIAVACNADLCVETDTLTVVLREGETILATWEQGTLLGRMMPDLAGLTVAESPVADELVFCEATLDDLLVVQAVGYAASHQLPIAFLRPSPPKSGRESANFEACRDHAERLVPPSLRAPSQPALTVFTRTTPLHLVRQRTDAEWPASHWATAHSVSHLPGQSASILIPRWFSDELGRVSPVSLNIFYNGLGSHGLKDQAGLKVATDRLLSHVLTLENHAARGEVLRETLERLPSSMLLIAAHGAERSIEMEQGRRVRDTEIANWRLAGSPVVFNNSCGSWTEVGKAFLQAGARAYVGTLWDITHEVAGEVATRLFQHMLAQPADGIARALASAVADHAAAATNENGGYIYVGLPQTSARVERPLNRFERLETATIALHQLYGVLHRLIDDGRVRIAQQLLSSVHAAVVAGFCGLQEPDDPFPLPLPPPFAGSVIDLGFVVGTADVQALRRMAKASPTEEQEELLMQCLAALDHVIADLSSWPERHRAFQDKHGREPDSDSGFIDAGTEIYRLMVHTTYEVILPLAKDCCDVAMQEAAHRLFALASVMVTIKPDLAEGTPPTPLTVLRRIRQGVPQAAQVYGSGERVEFDQLENAVNRSDLANRFGIVLRGLGDESSAVSFFELATELASGESPDHFNAAANRWRLADPLARLPQLFDEQLAAGDLDNAGITGSNLLLAAGAAKQPLPPDLLRKIEALPEQVSGVEARAAAECQHLGSIAVYHAGLGRFAEAESCTERIGEHLSARPITEPGGLSRATTSARALFEHLNEIGAFEAACAEGSRVAERLGRAELLEETLRAHFAVCRTAIEGYRQRGSDRFLATFLEHSRSAGRLVHDRPGLANGLSDMVEAVAENTTSIWHQAEANGQLEVALIAYDAQRCWRHGVTDPAWEFLRAARSEPNLEAVAAVAATGDLRRSATVSIGDDFLVTAKVTTSRSAAPGPPVISMWPFSSHLNSYSCAPDGAHIVARHLVMPLMPNGSMTVQETGLPHLHGDGRGCYLYSDVWGSRTIGYALDLRLPIRLLPQKIRLEGVARDTVMIEMRFVSDGCEVRIAPHSDSVRWIGRLDIYCFDLGDIRFPFTAVDGPFGDWVPVEFFEHAMDLLGRSLASRA